MSDSATVFDRRMLEALVCPVSQGTLSYDAERQELVSSRSATGFRSCSCPRRGRWSELTHTAQLFDSTTNGIAPWPKATVRARPVRRLPT